MTSPPAPPSPPSRDSGPSFEVSRARFRTAPRALTARVVNHASQAAEVRTRAGAAVRRAGRADLLCLGGIAVSIAYGYATVPLMPLLLRHIVAHLLVTGSLSALLTAGAAAHAGQLSIWVAAAAGVVGSIAFDGFYFWAGRRYSDAIAQAALWLGVPPRWVTVLETWVRRRGGLVVALGPFLPVPAALILLVSGASGVRWRTFVVCDAIGWYVWCLGVCWLGWLFHGEVDEVADWITRWSLVSALVGVAITVVLIAWRVRSIRRGPAA